MPLRSVALALAVLLGVDATTPGTVMVYPQPFVDQIPSDVKCPADCDEATVMCNTLFNSYPSFAVSVGATCEVEDNQVVRFSCTCNQADSAGPTYVPRDGGMCVYAGGRFPPSPPYNPGTMCTPQTGRCAVDCQMAGLTYCSAQGATGPVTCEDDVLTCDLCLGGTLRVRLNDDTAPSGENDTCVSWEPSRECAADTCSGHGCCSRGRCTCFQDDDLGYWAGATCDVCDPKYEGQQCNSARLSLTTIFGGEPSALPAVTPFLFTLLVYVCFSGLRRKWTHDQPLHNLLYLEPVRPTYDAQKNIVYIRAASDNGEVVETTVQTTYNKCREAKERPLVVAKRPPRSRGIKAQERLRLRAHADPSGDSLEGSPTAMHHAMVRQAT